MFQVCSRGGDLAMLEILTEVEETAQTKKRVAGILDEQRRTLRYAMSRPQVCKFHFGFTTICSGTIGFH